MKNFRLHKKVSKVLFNKNNKIFYLYYSAKIIMINNIYI